MEIPEHLELDVSRMQMNDTLRLVRPARAGRRHAARRSRGDGARVGRDAERSRSSPSRSRSEGEEGEAVEGEEGEAAEGAPRASRPAAKTRAASPAAPRARCASSAPRGRASSLDLLVVGLGNPGREHAQNRHNVGWMVVDELARRHGGSFKGKFSGQLAEVRDGDLRLALLKPELYMNQSGRSVAPAARFFKVAAGAAARRPRRGRPRPRASAGARRRRARRPQRPPVDRAGARDPGLPPSAHRRGPAGTRRPTPARRLRALELRAARRRGSDRLPRRRRRRDDRPRGPRAAQQRFN